MAKRQHIEDLGRLPTIGDLKILAKNRNIPDDAILSGWDDGSVAVRWWAEETPDEYRERLNREAQAAVNRERRGY